jgi:hypothetical protein
MKCCVLRCSPPAQHWSTLWKIIRLGKRWPDLSRGEGEWNPIHRKHSPSLWVGSTGRDMRNWMLVGCWRVGQGHQNVFECGALRTPPVVMLCLWEKFTESLGFLRNINIGEIVKNKNNTSSSVWGRWEEGDRVMTWCYQAKAGFSAEDFSAHQNKNWLYNFQLKQLSELSLIPGKDLHYQVVSDLL